MPNGRSETDGQNGKPKMEGQTWLTKIFLSSPKIFLKKLRAYCLANSMKFNYHFNFYLDYQVAYAT